MRYPEFLKPGGTIGFIAPSFGCAIEPYRTRFENAIKIFRDMGYGIWLGPNCYASSGIGISNKPSLCGEELNSAMVDTYEEYQKSDCIITCGGGELMCEVVPFIDYEKIKKSTPKWYMGYSDNTNYTFLSAVLADTAAVYGPCAPAFGRYPWHESIKDALMVLTGEKKSVEGYGLWEADEGEEEIDPLAPYNVTEKSRYFYYTPDTGLISGDAPVELKLSGRLLGGCLDILDLLVGTKYDRVGDFIDKYEKDGIIWFIESCDLDMLSMRRALWQLREAGWFRNARGFLIGRPRRFGEEVFGVDQYKAVTDIIGELGVPVIMDLDIGHLPPMMPIICGSTAEITATGNNIKIDYTYK